MDDMEEGEVLKVNGKDVIIKVYGKPDFLNLMGVNGWESTIMHAKEEHILID